ncbi:MAG: DUF2207 domain-containing protein [bacterium]|nr:DUF2207 domain-containing protein [bacterium]
MNSKAILFAFFLFSAVFSFTIDSYYTDATVQSHGDLLVHETITFTLDEAYNEGYRSIRPADYGMLGNVVVHSVTVNGQPVNYYTQEYGGNAEIVWTETFVGTNKVELNYTLLNRVELWDDYAKVCFEHYGANWAVPAKVFRAKTTLPEASRNKDMHFEVYSEKKGEAHIDDLSIIIEMEGVPSGNYIGGCYLFARDSVSTSKVVEGSAYGVLKEEREIYGSETIVSPEDNFCAPLCFPAFFILLIPFGYTYIKRPRFEKLAESILPPSKEEPVLISVLLRNEYKKKDMLAATILGLINKGVIDIMELEKKGYTGQEIKRERTILFLKKSSKTLKPYERAVIDMIFDEGKKKEVDLDALAEEFKQIGSKAKAKKTIIPKKIDEFNKAIREAVKKKKALEAARDDHETRFGIMSGVGIFAGFFFLFLGCMASFDLSFLIFYLLDTGQFIYAFSLLFAVFGSMLAIVAALYFYIQPIVPKGWEKKFEQWNAFSRAVKSSSLKEEPPSGALLWGEILVYATALGIADKVKKHLSELDILLAKRVEKMDAVRTTSIVLYSQAWGVRNLSKYGNRSGKSSSSFSGGSSGGWSSGGGGFSGGSSGGGGFR